jgi:hypothetical protein
MTDLIRLNPTRWPYSLAQLRLDEPSRSFSPAPSDAELAAYDVFRVQPSEVPVPDPLTERVVEVAPSLENGAWVQQWEIVALTEQEQAAAFQALNPPQWVAFGAVVQANPGINALLGTALQTVPGLAMSLSVGLGKAADGDSRVFMEAWMFARSLELVSVELLETLQGLAGQFNLPAEFIAALGAEVPE